MLKDALIKLTNLQHEEPDLTLKIKTEQKSENDKGSANGHEVPTRQTPYTN